MYYHVLLISKKVIEDAKEQSGPSKSTISKYFNKDSAAVTRSTQKKRAVLKNM